MKGREPLSIRVIKAVPCRIDLAGGTLDLWPLYLYFGGLELVNMAINVMASCEIEKTASSNFEIFVESADLHTSTRYQSVEELKASLSLTTKENPLRWVNRIASHWFSKNPDQLNGKWRVATRSEAPPGSGLGGSSVLGVALQLALLEVFEPERAKNLSDADRWALQILTRDLEAIEIEHPAGDQDYVPALFGGLIAMHLNESERRVEHLPLSSAAWVSDHVALLYTGKPHHSGLNNWQIFKALHEGDKTVRNALKNIGSISKELASDLRVGNFKNVASLVNHEWEQRQRLSSSICPPVLDEAWNHAESFGAVARKACGSGGGGSMLFVFDDATKKKTAVNAPLPSCDWKWLSTAAVGS